MSEPTEIDTKSMQEDGESGLPTTGRKTPSTDRVQTPDSQGRPKSTASGDIVFEAKKKRKRTGTPSSAGMDDAHDVTFTVTICMAVPTGWNDLEVYLAEHDDQPDLREILKKRMIDAPRAQNYYHLEYYLLPDEDELVKTDVVTYGVACKIYMERHDARVVKTWQDGDITWFSWAHSHTVTVTKEVLLKMFNHTIELRVWDTKDKCSSRARFDRPKAFRLPQPKPGEKPEDIGGVKAMVTKQMKNFVNQQPRKGEAIRPLPSQISVPNLVDARKLASGLESRRSRSGLITPSASSKALVAVPNRDGKEGRAFSRLGQLAGADNMEERSSPRDTKKAGLSSGGGRKDIKSSPSSAVKSPANSRTATRSNVTSLDPGDDKASRKVSSNKEDRELRKQLAEQAKANAERIKKYGICSIPIRLSLLFGDQNIVTNRLDQPLSGVEDMFLTVSLSSPLLSPRQKQELNPMVIQVKNVTNLPSTPLKYADLKLKCHPVFCKYKFFKEPDYVTPGKEHTKDIYWEDTNVVLLGTMKESELREYFSGPAMEVEVHDRDRKPEEVALKPTLFGDDLEDEKIANVGTVESRRTLHNPFQSRDKAWDPYGIARIDLSELLLGHRFLEIKVPVHNCPIPDILGNKENINNNDINKGSINSSKLIGVAGSVDGPVETPLTAGDYIEDTAMLKMKIELAHPLTNPMKLAAKEDIPTTKECPFSRIIFIFDYHNLLLLHDLQSLVMEINAKALGLETMPKHVIDAALSTYKLSVEQQCSLDLDIVTGFHVLDGERHIFVLEGLRDNAITFLWNALPQPENTNVRVLFNSDLSFSKRLYGPLDVDLCRIKLHEPLSIIVRQALLYIRDMVVRPCFDALTKLDQLVHMKQMKDVVRNDLFLTTEMVVSMSREFGVPFTQKDFLDLQPPTVEECSESVPSQPQPYQAEPSRNWTPIDNFNHTYINHLREAKEERDFLNENIMDVQQKSEQCRVENEKNKKPRISVEQDPACNYSTQHLNSVELAHKKLRQYMKEKDPDARFAYNQEYLSAMVCPTDVVEDMKAAEAESKAQWRTTKGWIFPGMKTTKESNVHPRKLDTARLDELQEDWVENHLHTNIFQSPLDRGFLPWQLREHEFELFVKPPPDFGNKEPLSIHLPGVKKAAEKLAEKRRQYEHWRERIIVDDVRQHFHRVLPETEMKMKGFYSSNQLDRQKALLKDPILKKAQAICGPDVNCIPSLCVVNDPFLDTQARAQGYKLVPAIAESSMDRFVGFNPGPYCHTWSQNNNHIPCRDYHHETFQSYKGEDFNVYHKNKEKTSKRHIVKLQPEEKENHLFRIPIFSASPYQRPLPDLSERSMSAQPIMTTKSQQDEKSTNNESSSAKNNSHTADTETNAKIESKAAVRETSSANKEVKTADSAVNPTTAEIKNSTKDTSVFVKNDMPSLVEVPPQPIQVAA